MVKEGATAPAFKTTDTNGESVSLKDFRGQKVVLYFYPKDDTPGCTKEACSFRDGFSKFKKRGITILGVSPDSEKSHQKFTAKYKLPFTLLADTDHSIADAYGVYGEKKRSSPTIMLMRYSGPSRSNDKNQRLGCHPAANLFGFTFGVLSWH
jgi:peroxiredoxin Q/BCP